MKDLAVIGGTSSSLCNIDIRSAAIEIGCRLAAGPHSILTCGNKHGVIGLFLDMFIDSDVHRTSVVLRGHEELNIHPAAGFILGVDSISERKRYFACNTRIVIALPGGLGTHDEIFSFLMETSKLKKILLLNVANYFDPLLLQLSNMVNSGLLKGSVLHSIKAYSDVTGALDACNQLLEELRQDTG